MAASCEDHEGSGAGGEVHVWEVTDVSTTSLTGTAYNADVLHCTKKQTPTPNVRRLRDTAYRFSMKITHVMSRHLGEECLAITAIQEQG